MDKEHFEMLVDKAGPNGCCIWLGRTRNGYGSLQFCGSTEIASRVSWWLYKGSTNNLFVLHKCDNKICVNPEHLHLGNTGDNRDDWFEAGGKNHNAEKTHCKYGHLFSGDNLFLDNKGNRQCRECKNIRNREYKDKQKRLSV